MHSAITAEGPIVDGYSVMPWGGFYGSDAAMTRDRLATLVADGELRFVDTGGFSLGDPEQIAQLVTQASPHVGPAVWHGIGAGTLYDCAGRENAIRTVKLGAATGVGAGAGTAPGGLKLGPPAAVQRLVSCLHDHHWNPTSSSTNYSSPTARHALAACAALLPAAVPGIR